MKSKTTKYARILIAGSALMMTSAAIAEEEVVEPEIVICDFHDGIIFDDTEITDEEIVIDDEIVDIEKPDSGDDSEVDEEIVIDDEIIEDGDVSDDHDVVICWDPDWVKRTDDGSENPEYLYMTTGGPTPEVQNNATGAVSSESADEQSAVAPVKTKTVTTNIRRAAAKPTAVIKKGRVFLR